MQRSLFHRLAAMLDALCAGIPVALAVPDLALLDRESLGALRTFYRRHPATAPDLVAGFDPRRSTAAADERGLVLESEAEDVWQIALGLLAVPGARAVELRGAPEEEPEGIAEAAPPADGSLDAAAFAHLAAAAADPGGDLAGLAGRVLPALRAAFESYAFATVLRLGLGLLALDPPLARDEAAELHGLTALAAHNRQFLTRGNAPLAAFLERHFRAAWEAEALPARKSAWAYRVAVALGRRQARFAEAIEWADRAIAQAAEPGIGALAAAHLEGWGRNIRALALLRSGRAEEAAAECQAAFVRLDAAIGGAVEAAAVAADPLLREAAFTHALLGDNLAALYHREGGERFAHWKEQADRIAEPFPELHRFEAITWIDLYRGSGRLGAALAKARQGLAAARAEQDAVREYTYAVHAADLLARRGEAREAFAAFAEAHELHRRLGAPFLVDVAPQAAAAALAAGLLSEAERRYAALLDDPAFPLSLDARAQLLAAWGETAARRGDGTAADIAEERLNEAIAAAVESGERDTLLAVAVAAGRAEQALGRKESAAEAYARALEIAAAGDGGAPPPPAALELAARLGGLETAGTAEGAGTDAGAALGALALLPAALDDGEAWQEVERLLAALDRAGARGRAEREQPEALALLLQAAEERSRLG